MLKAPKGTKDITPSNVNKWRYIEGLASDICSRFGYNEIRTPVFEHTELFVRGVGDGTDVVQKEMYTFEDKGGRSITLRPEGTASVARAYLENSLYSAPAPLKLYYLSSFYRYENTQKGRLREFHQFGVEVFGSSMPSIDAEVISLAVLFLEHTGIKDFTVAINSIGCPECRQQYNLKLKEFFDQQESLCVTCKQRFEKNTFRILDCKNPQCIEISRRAPLMKDNLCVDCAKHFDSVKKYLEVMGIEYEINPFIVRGLDYYTKTVFEITSDALGAQSAVCGGGRYDGLVQQLGGNPTSGIGFAIGLERLLMIMETQSVAVPPLKPTEVFIATIGQQAEIKAQQMVTDFRRIGISADRDHMGRSIKAQLKYADKTGVQKLIVLGDDEITSGKATLKDMKTGNQIPIEDLCNVKSIKIKE